MSFSLETKTIRTRAKHYLSLSLSLFERGKKKETLARGKTFTLNYTANKAGPKTSVDLFCLTPSPQWRRIKQPVSIKPGR